jgi:hypothetical protein
MDFSADGNKVEADRPDLFSAVFRTALDIFKRMAEFFTLTEAERTKAGIYIRRRGA